MEYKLWIGVPGRFPEEVNALVSLLGTKIVARESSVSLAAEKRDSFDWICNSEWKGYTGEFEGNGWIALQTSGTMGEPKWIKKRFAEILSQKRGKGTPDDKWLLCYNPARWAGISVIAHVLKNSAQLVVPQGLDPQNIVSAMLSATHVSLTPSMFRKILLHCGGDISAIPIRQITFGGEYASQKLLDDARAIWPEARITHVYASTELGDICAVSDGMEGLPREKLHSCEFTEDGELIIDGHATGDLWERRRNRLIFVSRRQEIINVGGAKVAPSLVEAACMSVPQVLECRAYAVKSALLGEVVGLDYVGAIDPKTLRTFLISAVPKYAVPAKISKVDAISVTAAGKVLRRV